MGANMRKVLIISTVNFGYDGITNVIMNYFRAIDKTNLRIDFVTINPIHNNLKAEIEASNSKIFELPDRKQYLKAYRKELQQIIKNHYDVIHVHGNSATMQIELLMAKQQGIPIRIAHCHNSTCSHKVINQILKPFFNNTYTHAIACSNLAGSWLFGKKRFLVLNNAIDLERFRYSQKSRDEYRRRYQLNNKLVIGHIGHFTIQKNHMFLLDVFAAIHKIRNDTTLVLIGDGTLRNEIEEKVKQLDLQQDVILLGNREDVAQLLQAMDVFVLPSNWEGLGMVLIEAQAAGLPCFASTAIPQEAKVTQLLEFISLNESPEVWAETIVAAARIDREEQCEYVLNKIREKHYDINDTVSQLKDIYFA